MWNETTSQSKEMINKSKNKNKEKQEFFDTVYSLIINSSKRCEFSCGDVMSNSSPNSEYFYLNKLLDFYLDLDVKNQCFIKFRCEVISETDYITIENDNNRFNETLDFIFRKDKHKDFLQHISEKVLPSFIYDNNERYLENFYL